jgi:hypothetical protein
MMVLLFPCECGRTANRHDRPEREAYVLVLMTLQ